MLAVAVWIGYNTVYTLRHLPEAYAAWDAGTLLVEYLKLHDDRWPTSWEDLLTVLESPAGEDITLYGSQAGDVQYARSLREVVAIDWSVDTAQLDRASPVTRPDGSPFPVLWQGADPNEMIREYLQNHGHGRQ